MKVFHIQPRLSVRILHSDPSFFFEITLGRQILCLWPAQPNSMAFPAENSLVPLGWLGKKLAPSAGFEPARPAPEAGALSPELRGHISQSSAGVSRFVTLSAL